MSGIYKSMDEIKKEIQESIQNEIDNSNYLIDLYPKLKLFIKKGSKKRETKGSIKL